MTISVFVSLLQFILNFAFEYIFDLFLIINLNSRSEDLNARGLFLLPLILLIKRIKDSKKRPLAFKSTDHEIKAIIKDRSKIYTKAQFKINCNKLTKTEIVEKIVKIYELN